MYQMYIELASFTNHMACLLGTSKGVPHSSGLSSIEIEIDVASSQAYFLQKRRGVGPLWHPMPFWICVETLIPCPSVVDKEGADTVGVHSSQSPSEL